MARALGPEVPYASRADWPPSFHLRRTWRQAAASQATARGTNASPAHGGAGCVPMDSSLARALRARRRNEHALVAGVAVLSATVHPPGSGHVMPALVAEPALMSIKSHGHKPAGEVMPFCPASSGPIGAPYPRAVAPIVPSAHLATARVRLEASPLPRAAMPASQARERSFAESARAEGPTV